MTAIAASLRCSEDVIEPDHAFLDDAALVEESEQQEDGDATEIIEDD